MTEDHPELCSKIRQSGLELLSFVDDGTLPDARLAWSTFASSQPVAVFSASDDETFTRYEELRNVWLEAARASRVLDADGEFLISVEGGDGAAPWARVRLGDFLSIEVLGEYAGHPSFVAMDRGGNRLCGIDTEEHGFWVIEAPARQR